MATFRGISVNPADTDSLDGTSSVAVTPVASMVAGDLAILFALRRNPALDTHSPEIDNNGGQSWTQFLTGFLNPPEMSVWWATFDGTWDADPSISIDGEVDPLSVAMLAFIPTSTANTWATQAHSPDNGTFTAPSGTTPVIIPGPRVTHINSVTLATYMTADNNQWIDPSGDGWTLPDGAFAQYRNNSGSNQCYAMAYNLQAAGARLADLSRQQTGLNRDPGFWKIGTWYEEQPTTVKVLGSTKILGGTTIL